MRVSSLLCLLGLHVLPLFGSRRQHQKTPRALKESLQAKSRASPLPRGLKIVPEKKDVLSIRFEGLLESFLDSQPKWGYLFSWASLAFMCFLGLPGLPCPPWPPWSPCPPCLSLPSLASLGLPCPPWPLKGLIKRFNGPHKAL